MCAIMHICFMQWYQLLSCSESTGQLVGRSCSPSIFLPSVVSVMAFVAMIASIILTRTALVDLPLWSLLQISSRGNSGDSVGVEASMLRWLSSLLASARHAHTEQHVHCCVAPYCIPQLLLKLEILPIIHSLDENE